MLRFINYLFKNVASTVLVHRIIFYLNENLEGSAHRLYVY